MTKLRDQMTQDMVLRGLSPNTQRAYLWAVTLLAQYYNRSPDGVSEREVKGYLLHLHQDKKLSTSTCNLAAAAMRFLYPKTLDRSCTGFEIPIARKQKLLRLTGIDIQRCPACHLGRMVIVAEIAKPGRCSLRLFPVEICDSS